MRASRFLRLTSAVVLAVLRGHLWAGSAALAGQRKGKKGGKGKKAGGAKQGGKIAGLPESRRKGGY